LDNTASKKSLSLISAVSNKRLAGPAAMLLAGCLIPAVAGLFGSAPAFAIDGNYSSPYASQYDSRSPVATIPDETWLGVLSLLLNGSAAAFYAVRHRRKRAAAG
jgi:hypothetical protein